MIHLQLPVTDWLQAVQRLPAGSLVKAFSVQWLSEARATNPLLNNLHRYVNDGIQGVNPNDTEAVREMRARDWFNRFIDGTFLDGSTSGVPHWQATDMVSWWNEYYAESQTPAEKELWWRQERTAARIWRDEYRNGPHANKLNRIKLAICAAAVGNNIPWQSAQTATTYDCVLDYHPYDHFAAGQRDPHSWQFHSGRWNTMDIDFRQRGYTVKWVFGEAGPYESAVTGWRHPTVVDGNIDRYVEVMRTWIREVKGTHAYQTGRILGFALFTTVGGTHWPWFQTRQPELNALADMVAQEWTTAPVPPPPPPPPPPNPNPCRGAPRTQYGRVVYVLPENATVERAQQIAAIARPLRRTQGYSYDDGGIGDLDSRRVILVDIPVAQRQIFVTWYNQHYPGVTVEFYP